VRQNYGKYGSALTALRRTRITPDKFGPAPERSQEASSWLPGNRPIPKPASARAPRPAAQQTPEKTEG